MRQVRASRDRPEHSGGPDHLVAWLRGRSPDLDPPVMLDGELAVGFDLRAWSTDYQRGYPNSLAATVHCSAGVPCSDAPAHATTDVGTLVDAIRFGTGRFTGDTSATMLAPQRAWTRRCLAGNVTEAMVEDVVLIVDEMVSNVGEHSDTWFTIDLVRSGDHVVVGVSDPNPAHLARFSTPASPDPSGWGLLVVRRIARSWGQVLAPHTKTVWASIADPNLQTSRTRQRNDQSTQPLRPGAQLR